MGQSVALGAVAGQAGCAIVLLIVVGLGVGVWLDGRLGTAPAFTLSLVLISIPVSLIYAIFSVLRAARAFQNGAAPGAAAAPETEKERDS